MGLLASQPDGRGITSNRGPPMEIVIIIFYVLSVLVAIARFITRGLILRAFGADDYLMMLAVVFSTVIFITTPLIVQSGSGVHQNELSHSQVSYVHKMAWISQVFYLPCLCALKCSILGLYSRIAVQSRHRIMLYFVGAIIVIHAIATTVVNICLCKPEDRIWNPNLFPSGCIQILSFNYFNAGFHITSDLVLVVIPIPILRGLQIGYRRKIGLVVLFSVGIMVVAITVTRVAYVCIWGANPMDFTWYWMPVALTTALEKDTAIIFACLPALSILVEKAIKKRSFSKETRYSGEIALAGPIADSAVERNRKSQIYRNSLQYGYGYNATTFTTNFGEGGTGTRTEGEERIGSVNEFERERREQEGGVREMGMGMAMGMPEKVEVFKTVDYGVRVEQA